MPTAAMVAIVSSQPHVFLVTLVYILNRRVV